MIVKSWLNNLFWRVYGGFWESHARKHVDIQSVSDKEGIYFIDRATGKPVLGRNGENLDPRLKKRGNIEI